MAKRYKGHLYEALVKVTGDFVTVKSDAKGNIWPLRQVQVPEIVCVIKKREGV